MIRIIAGEYGYKGRDGIIRPKTAKSGPFHDTPEMERRLIEIGMAEAVEDPQKAEKEAKECPPSKTK